MVILKRFPPSDTRILLTFLLDEKARPRKDDMKLWVDALRFVKRGSPGGALGFFTYMELSTFSVLFYSHRLAADDDLFSNMVPSFPSIPFRPAQMDVLHHARVGCDGLMDRCLLISSWNAH